MCRWRLAFVWGALGLLVPAARAGDWRPLFDGKTLDGWAYEGNPGTDKQADGRPVWSVRDGMLRCEGNGFGFLRYEREKFKDFTFHVEYKTEPGCNSGIGFRGRSYEASQSRATRPSFYSYEIQISDDSGKPPTKTSSGSLYRYLAPKVNATRPAGEWNVLEVTAKGPHIQVVLNGQTIQDVDQSTVKELADKPLEGFVCLQNHGGNLLFREVKIRDE